MKSFGRSVFFVAAGLVAFSLPAHAAGSTASTDARLAKSATTTTPMQMAQRPYDPSAGSVGFRNENPGGVGFKKSKKKKKAKR
jgi:hypothetical protein